MEPERVSQPSSCDMDLLVQGETLRLLPERAVYWPARETLWVADLHWGKSETFRQNGIPIPGDLFLTDLQRLTTAIVRTKARRLLVLGDLIHGKEGLTPELIHAVSEWRRTIDCELALILGNHDRHCQVWPPGWRMTTIQGFCEEGPFLLSHHPMRKEERYAWSGHLHPTVLLREGRQTLRLPCFQVGRHSGVLPAFSEFTGGGPVKRSMGDRIFAIAGNFVVET